jgi:glycosyltransferase involved in cell wall biosynthesis
MNKEQPTLAIIIPAYKIQYIDQTLQSISQQTCKNFTLYIGDDCSEYNLWEVINPYKGMINIKYHRFETNLGGNDLIAHWDRCIELVGNEEWLWLFSDDDQMMPNCVKYFYEALSQTNDNFDLYRFNNQIIDGKGQPISELTVGPTYETSLSFLKRKLSLETNSYMVEYIFRKSIYKKYNGFVKFPLAWGSDDATWALFAQAKGIYTIQNAYVSWRYSGINLSSLKTMQYREKKLNAVILFTNWIKINFNSSVNDNLLLRWSLYQYSLVGGQVNMDGLFFYLKLIKWSKINKGVIIKNLISKIVSYLRHKL